MICMGAWHRSTNSNSSKTKECSVHSYIVQLWPEHRIKTSMPSHATSIRHSQRRKYPRIKMRSVQISQHCTSMENGNAGCCWTLCMYVRCFCQAGHPAIRFSYAAHWTLIKCFMEISDSFKIHWQGASANKWAGLFHRIYSVVCVVPVYAYGPRVYVCMYSPG